MKKIFTLLLAVAASVGIMFAESGICGPSTTWRLSNDTLYLDGNGEVYGGHRGYLWWEDFDNSKLIQITTLVIGENITFLGDQLCYGMNNLRSIVLNAKYCGMNSWSRNSAGNDGDGPFYAYADFDITGQIQEVTIGNNVDTIFCRFFEGMSAIKNIHYYATNAYYKENHYSYDTPFYDAFGISYIEIGENVQKLYPFNNKTKNSDSTIIQYNAIDFQLEHRLISDPSKVKSIILGNKVKNIPNGFASSCSNVKSIILPNSIQSIGNSAFSGCTGLTSVTIPNSVTSIGEYAFRECSSLTSVTIPNSVTSIGDRAFYNCTGLTSINVETNNPNYCSVEGVLFNKDKTRLIQYPGGKQGAYTIPNSVTSIGDRAFYNCTGLTSVTIPNSVTSIGFAAFGGCSSLTSVTIGNSVTSIEEGAFSECSSLTSITIPNSVTSIGSEAFESCYSLKTVVLGSSVKVLETFAFAYCSALETITCYSMRPPTVNQNALYGLDYSTIVYVPADYLNTYKMHDAWGLYDVRPLGATSAETEDVKITPSENEANVTWPSVSGAASYELVIKDKDGNIVCTLIFNANGQLTSIAFNAPSRNGVPAQTQSTGFSFTITGLDSGTGYDLTLTAKDNSGNIIEETTIPFHTDYPEGIEDVQSDEVQSTKVIKDGQVLILRNGKTYTMQGQEVK